MLLCLRTKSEFQHTPCMVMLNYGPVVSYAFIYRAPEPVRTGRQRQPTAAARAFAEENDAKKQRVGGKKTSDS